MLPIWCKIWCKVDARNCWKALLEHKGETVAFVKPKAEVAIDFSLAVMSYLCSHYTLPLTCMYYSRSNVLAS